MTPEMSVTEMLDSFILIVKGSRVLDRKVRDWGRTSWDLNEKYIAKNLVYTVSDLKRYFAHRVVKSKNERECADPFNDWLTGRNKFVTPTLPDAMKFADRAARGLVEPRLDIEAILEAGVRRASATYRVSFSGKLGQSGPASAPQSPPIRLFPQFANDPQTAERLATGVIANELRRMAPQAGWDEKGGHMIRKSEDWNSPDYHVVGRTKWLPREPWFRDLSKLPKGGDYAEVVERALAGGTLTAKERRMVASMAELASERLFSADPEADVLAQVSAAIQEVRARVETRCTEEEYLAYANDQERAINEWLERETQSSRADQPGPAQGARRPDGVAEHVPAG